MSLLLPRDLLIWVDEKRGPLSRQAFIVRCLFKIMEVDQIKNG